MPPVKFPPILQLPADGVFIPVAPFVITAHTLIAAKQRHHAPRHIALGKRAVHLPGKHIVLVQRVIAAVVQLIFIKSRIASHLWCESGIAHIGILSFTRVGNEITIVPAEFDTTSGAENRRPLPGMLNVGRIVIVHLGSVLGVQRPAKPQINIGCQLAIQRWTQLQNLSGVLLFLVIFIPSAKTLPPVVGWSIR